MKVAKLRYVCLSDLHLGADYSILTNNPPPKKKSDPSCGKSDPSTKDPAPPSKTLTALGAAARKMVSYIHDPASPPPKLLLLGDVLDLAFSPVNQTAMAFQRFIEAMFPDEAGPFSSTILYVPGNHDHLVWEWVKDSRYIQQLKELSGTTSSPRRICPLSPVTPMFGQPTLQSDFLTQLMQICGVKDPSVKVAYPNFGDATSDGKRGIVFHHGHFIESIYRLMSDARSLLEPDFSLPRDIGELERENATWIDFGWSTFGSTGRVGLDIEHLYMLVQNNAAFDRFLSRLSKRITKKLLPYLLIGGETQTLHYAMLLTKALLDVTLERWSESERFSYLSVLTDASIEGLSWYLQEPVYQQIDSEHDGKVPDDITFIFGHTHKPFEDALPLAKYTLPVNIFNTGGWVLDEPKMLPFEGAAAVFIDDDLNVVSLRLYNDPINDQAVAVHIPDNGAYPADTQLNKDAVEALHQTADLWNEFTKQAAEELRARCNCPIRQSDDLGEEVDGEKGSSE